MIGILRTDIAGENAIYLLQIELFQRCMSDKGHDVYQRLKVSQKVFGSPQTFAKIQEDRAILFQQFVDSDNCLAIWLIQYNYLKIFTDLFAWDLFIFWTQFGDLGFLLSLRLVYCLQKYDAHLKQKIEKNVSQQKNIPRKVKCYKNKKCSRKNILKLGQRS